MSHDAKDSLLDRSFLTPSSGISLSTRYFLFSCKRYNLPRDETKVKTYKMNKIEAGAGTETGEQDKLSAL